MPNLPKRTNIPEDYNNIHCEVFSNTKKINVYLLGDPSNNYSDLFKVLSKYNDYDLDIINVSSRNELNKICSIFGVCDFSGNVIIDLMAKNNSKASIKDLTNNKVINIESLPDFVKIRGFFKDNSQSDFTTWAHNLNTIDKTTLLGCLTDDDKELFLNQERVIKLFYDELIGVYPNIMSFDEKRRFEIVYMYVYKNFPYSFEVIGEDGDARPECYYSKDAIETYKRRRGVCVGRANLLTLVTNNPLLKCNCTTISGLTEPSTRYPNGQDHCWNVYVDSNGRAYHYDLSFNSFSRNELHNIGKRTITKVYYSNVQELLDRGQTPPALPPRSKTYRPLPPRRKD